MWSVDPLNGYTSGTSDTSTNLSQPINITTVVLDYWSQAALALWGYIVPPDNSVFYLSLQNTGLSSIRLSYSRISF
jgi:hypothetical protein